jgi:hypothetical protein
MEAAMPTDADVIEELALEVRRAVLACTETESRIRMRGVLAAVIRWRRWRPK